jgi:hypothetical protein
VARSIPLEKVFHTALPFPLVARYGHAIDVNGSAAIEKAAGELLCGFATWREILFVGKKALHATSQRRNGSPSESGAPAKAERAVNRDRFRLYLFQTRKLGDAYEVLFGHG